MPQYISDLYLVFLQFSKILRDMLANQLCEHIKSDNVFTEFLSCFSRNGCSNELMYLLGLVLSNHLVINLIFFVFK